LSSRRHVVAIVVFFIDTAGRRRRVFRGGSRCSRQAIVVCVLRFIDPAVFNVRIVAVAAAVFLRIVLFSIVDVGSIGAEWGGRGRRRRRRRRRPFTLQASAETRRPNPRTRCQDNYCN
jgi:hypothetical protein